MYFQQLTAISNRHPLSIRKWSARRRKVQKCGDQRASPTFVFNELRHFLIVDSWRSCLILPPKKQKAPKARMPPGRYLKFKLQITEPAYHSLKKGSREKHRFLVRVLEGECPNVPEG